MGNALLAVLVFCEPCAHGFAQLPPTPTVPLSMPYQPACQSPFGLDDCTRAVFLGYCLVYWSVCVCVHVHVMLLLLLLLSLHSLKWPQRGPLWFMWSCSFSFIVLALAHLFPVVPLSLCPPLSWPPQSSFIHLVVFFFFCLLFFYLPVHHSLARPVAIISRPSRLAHTHTHTHIHHQLGSFLIYWAMSSLTTAAAAAVASSSASAHPPSLPFSTFSLFSLLQRLLLQLSLPLFQPPLYF